GRGGGGGGGKTTLLKALTGSEPRAGEPTTHGVNIDIQALCVPHAHREGIEISLNAWDFGGQEVYRVTHQFFFSRRSIYLVVWEPRKGVQQCQVEDWLKLIRLRVGDDARVIIVSTHCRTGERIARIDKPVLERDFGSLIVGFCEVDSLVRDPSTDDMVGIAELRGLIARAASELEQMGTEFNRDWREARDEVLALAEPRIPYAQFAAVCGCHGLDDTATRTLARLMHDLGYIVYFGDDERLKEDVVLQPEWLTKAIGFVLEDPTTEEMDGILPDARLHEVWRDHAFAGETRYDPERYPFFLRLMERYDVSYRLEEARDKASLVAQHVPQVRPRLPWLAEDEPTPGLRRVAMVCVMEEAPPGLVPWMIVRTHRYAYGLCGPDGKQHRLHWQKGMFLQHTVHGQALLELREREFHIHAEAVWPVYFMTVLQRTLHRLIADNWPGLEGRYYFAVPCQGRQDGHPCQGRFRIDALREFLRGGITELPCQFCYQSQDVIELLYGFEDEPARDQLARIEARLAQGIAELQRMFGGLESRIADHVMAIMRAMADEGKAGPRLFTVGPRGGWHKLDVRRFVKERFRLHLWCEAEGCEHPVMEKGKGTYEFTADRDWVRQIAPYASFVAGMLRTVAPMVAPAVNACFGANTLQNLGIEAQLDLMKEGTGQLLGDRSARGEYVPTHQGSGVLTEAERSGILALHALLRKLDPNQQNLGLHRVYTPTGDFMWLCRTHYDLWQPNIPDKIE
ncbi:MAG: hypothetical protein FJX75_26275, partial [Armatimonadetes bacterium]|nr:hypothetical protein [Armatimonadota bacterium]